MDTPKHQKEKEESSSGIKPYLKYSGMAFQMVGVLVLAAFAGIRLDAYFKTAVPWFTIVLLLLAVVATMVLTIISITKK